MDRLGPMNNKGQQPSVILPGNGRAIPAAPRKAPGPLEIAAQYLMAQFFGQGFALVIFPLGKPGVNQIISNATNESTTKILKSVAESLEKQAGNSPKIIG